MSLPRLVKRRLIWLPTIWGTLLCLIALFFLGLFLLKNVAFFLSEQAPVNSNILVVEGWLEPTELQQALTEFNRGDYDLLVTTGGPELNLLNSDYSNYAEQAAAILKKMGLPAAKIVAVPAPASAQERTYLSAVMVRLKLQSKGINPRSLNVFSGAVHARRTHLLYQLAFRQQSTEIGILAAKPDRFSLKKWWKTSEGAKSVITEMIGWLWVKCCYSPGAIGSHQELWGRYLEKSER